MWEGWREICSLLFVVGGCCHGKFVLPVRPVELATGGFGRAGVKKVQVALVFQFAAVCWWRLLIVVLVFVIVAVD